MHTVRICYSYICICTASWLNTLKKAATHALSTPTDILPVFPLFQKQSAQLRTHGIAYKAVPVRMSGQPYRPYNHRNNNGEQDD